MRRVKIRRHKRKKPSGGFAVVKSHKRRLRSKDDIWRYTGVKPPYYYPPKSRYRIMERIITPNFKTPRETYKYMWGNTECRAICESKYLPRNAILIKVKKIDEIDIQEIREIIESKPDLPIAEKRNLLKLLDKKEAIDERIAKMLYAILDILWKSERTKHYAHGTLQLSLNKRTLKNLLKEKVSPDLLEKIEISILDNIDNSTLKKNDLLLSRVGSERSVGKPFLILENYLEEEG
jgi:hypothetical protein